jgi:transposase
MYFKHVTLTEEEHLALEQGYRQSSCRAFSQRCHIILLKAQGRRNAEIGEILGKNIVTIGSWVNRYLSEGIEGLKTKPGRGRKHILDVEKDTEKVRQAVQEERQRLSKAKDKLEGKLNKRFSLRTLQRFLKDLSADTNGYA